MKQINKQILSQEHETTLRCYKLIKETLSDTAFYELIMCKVDTLGIHSNIHIKLRDELDNEIYESLSKK
jgi:hypothetical protein